MPRHGEGPIPARILIVGESYSYEDERALAPFQGTSGQEFNKMLHEAGIMRSECYLTNLVNARAPSGNTLSFFAQAKKDITPKHVKFNERYVLPPVVAGYQRLLKEIERVQPNIIVTMGEASTWALTGLRGVTKWRGSMLKTSSGRKLIPTLAHWTVASQWENRVLIIADLRRAAKERETKDYTTQPDWHFLIRPRLQTVVDILTELLERAEAATEDLWIDFDLETRAGHISCAGISWSLLDALCIPLMERECLDGYWDTEEEAVIVHLLYRLLTHPKVAVRGQNLLFDCQYTWRWWHFVPRVKQDTMISSHTAFVALPKSLDFLASLHCRHYTNWKPEKTSWKGA